MTLLAALVWCSNEHAPAAQTGRPLVPFDRFRTWLDLARTHKPGQVDASIHRLREIPLDDFIDLRIDFEALVQFLHEPGLARLRRPGREYSAAELVVLSQMALAETQAGAAMPLLRQVALLHSDSMMLPGGVALILTQGSSRTQPDSTVMRDGVSLGGAVTPPHWRIARSAVGALLPSAAADPWARQWYEATTAYLFYSLQFAVLPAHLDGRRALMPDDLGVAFDEACVYEEYASDRIQQAVAAERRPGFTHPVPERRPSLERAQQLFERVIAGAPAHAEARLRLARVRWGLGDASRAIDELTALLPSVAGDRELAYYAQLFLGAAHKTAGNVDKAIAAYQAALKLFPAAQSAAVAALLLQPRLAEADIAGLESLLRAPAVDRDDPWRNYYLGPGRKVHVLLDALWRSPTTR